MSVGHILQALGRLSDFFAAGGADAQTKDLNLLIEALSPEAEHSVDQLVAEIEALSKQKSKKEPKPAKVFDLAIVEKYLRSLKQADDLDSITAVIAMMKQDKIDKPHLFQIAAEFTGSGPQYKTTSDAFARIRGAFIEQKRFENKLKAAHLD